MIDLVGIKFTKYGNQKPSFTSLASLAFGLKTKKPVKVTFRNLTGFWDISRHDVEYVIVRYTRPWFFWFFKQRNVLELTAMYRKNKSLTLKWYYNGEQIKQRTIKPKQICDAMFDANVASINGSETQPILNMRGPVFGKRVKQNVPPAYFDTEL